MLGREEWQMIYRDFCSCFIGLSVAIFLNILGFQREWTVPRNGFGLGELHQIVNAASSYAHLSVSQVLPRVSWSCCDDDSRALLWSQCGYQQCVDWSLGSRPIATELAFHDQQLLYFLLKGDCAAEHTNFRSYLEDMDCHSPATKCHVSDRRHLRKHSERNIERGGRTTVLISSLFFRDAVDLADIKIVLH